jgi:hypothetical protein
MINTIVTLLDKKEELEHSLVETRKFLEEGGFKLLAVFNGTLVKTIDMMSEDLEKINEELREAIQDVDTYECI